jgi:2-keto-myo-inositol isomerase
MLTRKRFSLSRIVSPALSMQDFFKLTTSLGLSKVELRNDLPGKESTKGVVDNMKPEEVAKMARNAGVKIITINAVQKFNLPSMRKFDCGQMKELCELAAAINCPAIVMCPNNDAADKRSPREEFADLVQSLRDYAPILMKYNITAYLEPLGFEISSLRSLPVAEAAIDASGYYCYRTVFDTFHHAMCTDKGMLGMEGCGAYYKPPYTGLVHISGLEDDIPVSKYLDANRVLVGPKDRMHNKEIIHLMDSIGYQRDFSYEPFSPAVQKLSFDEIKKALDASLKYIGV